MRLTYKKNIKLIRLIYKKTIIYEIYLNEDYYTNIKYTLIVLLK